MAASLTARLLTARCLTAILAAASLVAIAALLLAHPASTLARGSGTVCSTSFARAAQSHACARSARGNRGSGRLKAKARHARHPVARRRHRKAKALPKVPPASTTATVPAPTAALCEDGTNPVGTGAGYYSCPDGSAPACPGSNPTFSSDGSGFACGAPTTEMAAPGEPACEDGSAPAQAPDGSLSCADGSEATCEDGSPPSILEGATTPICRAGANDPTGADEPTCEDGSAPVREVGGLQSCVDGSQPTCPDGMDLVSSSEGVELACELS